MAHDIGHAVILLSQIKYRGMSQSRYIIIRNKQKSKVMNIFNYIIQMGASVMMPILFTIIGLCIGMKFGKALKSGLYVGVGFVGLGIVTALLTNNFKDPLQAVEDIFNLNLSVFDMGW